MYNILIKKWIDNFVCFLCFILFSPLFYIAAIVVILFIGRPIIFTQDRPGKGGKPFRLYKFRTMTNERDKNGRLLPDENRINKIGKAIRSTSLDELLELINVMKGEMSLIGPRPLLMEYLPLYTKEQFRRHEVLPGITGLAQVSGRNELSWEEKFKLDVWYVDHQSFWLDMKILFRSFVYVISRKGIGANGHATMPKFQGTIEGSPFPNKFSES